MNTNTELENQTLTVCDQTNDELMDDAVLMFNRLYITERKRFVVMRHGRKPAIPKRDGKYEYLCDAYLMDHVMLRYSIAVYSGSASKFVCFDVDDGDKDTVHRLIGGIEAFGIPREHVHVSFSGRKGYHVEIFFNRPVDVAKLKLFYGHICSLCGLDTLKVEYRPDVGRAIKLPLSIHHETGARCWFVDRDTLEPVKSYDPLFDIRQISAEDFLILVNTQARDAVVPDGKDDVYEPLDIDRDKKMKRVIGGAMDIHEAGVDIPLMETGTRHNTMLRIAVYLRYQGVEKKECVKRLVDWLLEQDPKLYRTSRDEAIADAVQIADWAYGTGFSAKKNGQRILIPVSRHEMERVLEQPTKHARKLYFVFLVNEKAGTPRVSHERLSGMLGLCVSSVKRYIQALQRAGEIRVKAAKRKKIDGKYCNMPNQYSIVRQDGDCGGVIGGPREQRVEVPLRGMWGCLDNAYYAALDQTFSTRELLNCFDANELAEYKRYLNSAEDSANAS